jgi:hypothetical protein
LGVIAKLTYCLPGPERERSPLFRHASAHGQSIVEFALVLPIVLMLLLAVGDMARLYMSMITVESAAREAADFGAYGSQNWDAANRDETLAAMERLACTASRHLNDYETTSGTCTNPSVDIKLMFPDGTVAGSDSDCGLTDRPDGPCRVQVDMEYRFDLIIPIAFDVNGQRFGFPESLTFSRSSVFVNSDFLTVPW